MSKTKRKNSNYNYKNREIIAKEKDEANKKRAKSEKRYWILTLLLWAILITIVGLVVSKYNGSMPNSEKVFMPLTAIAMFLLAYDNRKLGKTGKIVVYILGALEMVFSIYIIFFK